MFADLRRTHAVLPIPAGSPSAWGGQVQSVVFEDSWGLYAEATLYLADHRAVLFADLAFGGYGHKALDSNLLSSGLGSLVGINRRIGCPVAYPLFMKDRHLAAHWLRAVDAWPYDTFLCSHVTPVLRQPRQDFRRAFNFVGAATTAELTTTV